MRIRTLVLSLGLLMSPLTAFAQTTTGEGESTPVVDYNITTTPLTEEQLNAKFAEQAKQLRGEWENDFLEYKRSIENSISNGDKALGATIDAIGSDVTRIRQEDLPRVVQTANAAKASSEIAVRTAGEAKASAGANWWWIISIAIGFFLFAVFVLFILFRKGFLRFHVAEYEDREEFKPEIERSRTIWGLGTENTPG